MARTTSPGIGSFPARPPDPQRYGSWKEYAAALSAYVSNSAKVTEGAQPEAIQLLHLDTTATAARTVTDGLTVYDPVLEHIMVSVDGVWQRVTDRAVQAALSDITTDISDITTDISGHTSDIADLTTDVEALRRANRIINGAFDIWQRGTSSTAAGFVAADRWMNAINGGTVTQSQQAFTVGDILGQNSPTYYLRQNVSGQTLASQYAITDHRIEGVRSYAGQTITVMGWARRSSGTGNMAIEGVQVFGTGGSPSSPVTAISPTTVTLTGSWAPFAVTLTVPSITGKTLGTGGGDYFSLHFWASGGSDYNTRSNSLGLQTIGVDLWGIHIAMGTHTTATTLKYIPPARVDEVVACQRYYQTGYLFAQGYSVANTYMGTGCALQTPMRKTPAVGLTLAGNSAYVSSLTVQNISSVSIGFNALFGTSNGAYALVEYTADAEL